jgi:DnaK suppressor protein
VPSSPPTEPIDAAVVRARLGEQRDRLLAQLGAAVPARDGDLTATHGIGETEHIVLGVERGIASAVGTKARAALEDVAAALARLDDGSYGVCASCHLPIGLERLEAMPEARWCVVCQAERSRRR